MPISDDLKRVYVDAQHQNTYIETLTLHHSRFTQTYYLANDFQEWRFQAQRVVGGGAFFYRDFLPFSFEVKLPTVDSSGLQELTISIANADRLLLEEIEAAQEVPEENITCIYSVYLDIPDSQPQIDPRITLSITDIQVSLQTINATASRFDILGRQFPKGIYNLDDFPGLRR